MPVESTLPVRNCTLLDCHIFIGVDFVCLFVCYAYAAPTFCREWNKEVLHLALSPHIYKAFLALLSTEPVWPSGKALGW